MYITCIIFKAFKKIIKYSNWFKQFKTKLDNLDIEKLDTTPIDFILSNIVKNDVLRKTEYDELVENVNNINTADDSDLVKKADYKTNINEMKKKTTDHIHDKYITTQEFNKLTSEKFTARLKQANLVCKSHIACFVKKTDFDDKLKILNKKVSSNKTCTC